MNLGAVYGWERYDRDRRSVDVTDEHSGKIYVDANPVDWMRARASFLYGERRYGTYDEFNFEEKPRGILTEGTARPDAQFDVADRNRKKAEAQVEITPFQLVTITPNFGLRYDDFPDSIANQLGVSQDRSWNAGIEVGLTFDPSIRVLAAYNYETRNLKLADCCGGAPATDFPGNTWRSDVEQRFNTLMAALDWKAIPNRLEFRFEYLEAPGARARTPPSTALPGLPTAPPTRSSPMRRTASSASTRQRATSSTRPSCAAWGGRRGRGEAAYTWE